MGSDVAAVQLINAADDNKNNDFKYPVVDVIMKRVDCQTQPGGRKSN